MRSKGLCFRVPNTLACSPIFYLARTSHNYAFVGPCDSENSLNLHNIISSLHLCGNNTHTRNPKVLHTYIASNGLETIPAVRCLVPMFLASGNVVDAQRIFDKLHHQSTQCISSLISGYIECGQLQNAIALYQQMLGDVNNILLALLKACTRLKAMKEGRDLHTDIIRKGFEQDVYIGSTLIDMYAKYGSVVDARSVLNSMCDRNVVSWNALIAGYVDHEPIEKTLCCFHQMQSEGVAIDAVTCTIILKACHIMVVVRTGMEIHGQIVKIGLEQNIFVGSSLVSMYAKCGALIEAWDVFHNLQARDAVLWTTLLSGCAEHGAGEEALKYFEQMRKEGIFPTAYVYACSLKACGSVGMIHKGREIHLEVVKRGCEDDIYVGSSLVDMYVKHGLLSEGKKILDEMPVRNSVSWNALIAGYADHAPGLQVLECHKQMLLDHVSPDAVTLACCLKSCDGTGATEMAHKLHTEILHKGLENDLVVGTALVDVYANSAFLLEAQDVFDKMTNHSVVSWNVLMTGYAEHGSAQQALKCFEDMKLRGISPSAITLSSVLEACGNVESLDNGQKVHSEVIEKGFERDYYVGNVLVNLYAKRGFLADARQIFHKLPLKTLESWTAMILGYTEHEWSSEALSFFEQMRSGGIFLDAIVFVCVLKACGIIKALGKGQALHIDILKRGFERDPFVGITLVDVYCKCGLLSDGRNIFNRLPDQSTIAWNALIGGYSEHGPAQIALECYDSMLSQNVSPSIVTYVSILKACCKVGAIEKGRDVHKELRQKGLEADPFVASTIIVMYAVCGSLSEAWEAFSKLPGPSAVSWNAMLKGFGINHEGDMALCLFEDMQQQGVKPDVVTFLCLLATCSRASLVLDARKYFQTMMQDYNIVPTLQHLACMVDVLARSGHLHQADRLFESLPHLPSKAMWTVLLSACQTYAEVELAQKCFQRLVGLDCESGAPYSLMASIYANAGRWDDVKKIEELRKLAVATNVPAISVTETINVLEQPGNC